MNDRNSERRNFVAVNADKRPFIRNWQNVSWGQQKVYKGQYGVGFKQSVSHTTIDVDTSDLNGPIDRLCSNKALLVKSGSGKRHIIISQTEDSHDVSNSHLYLDGVKVCDLLTRYNKQAVMPNIWKGQFDLPASDRYELINGTEEDFFNPPTCSLFGILEVLNLRFKPKTIRQIKVQEHNQDPKGSIISPPSFTICKGLEDFLPTGDGQNNGLIFEFLWELRRGGNWDNRKAMFELWLSSNKFLRKPLKHYWENYNSTCNKIELASPNQNKLDIKGVIYNCSLGLDVALSTSKNRQLVYSVCMTLAHMNEYKEFFLSMNIFDGVHPNVVRKALEWLKKEKVISVHKQGVRWSKGQTGTLNKGLNGSQATHYKFLKEIAIK